MKQILVTWIGRTDLRAATESEAVGLGPIAQVLTARSFDDPGIFIELPLVNQIRPRVQAWRETGYPGMTGFT